MTAILTQIVEILVSGISSFGLGLGQGLQDIVTAMFIESTGDTQALSIFGGLVVVFAGIGLAVGLTRRCFTWLSTLGGSR